ncbi:MAG: hypothetical protein MJ062_05515 [Oscillospiraceae bacterium]|nr:hypothetical protein [Oscillospiraceae bacterium]
MEAKNFAVLSEEKMQDINGGLIHPWTFWPPIQPTFFPQFKQTMEDGTVITGYGIVDLVMKIKQYNQK